MRLALTFATILALHAQTQPIPQDPDKARLEGVVLNSATGEPLRKTTLTLRMNVAAPAPNQPRPPETTYTVSGIYERDRQLLEFLEHRGVRPGAKLRLLERNYDQTLTLSTPAGTVSLGPAASERVWLSPAARPKH